MIPVNSLIDLLAAALKIWEHKEANKYRDRFDKYSRILKEEYGKPENNQDFAIIDDAEFELKLLRDGFITEVSRSKA